MKASRQWRIDSLIGNLCNEIDAMEKKRQYEPVTRDTINCYRANYRPDDWEKIWKQTGRVTVPSGAVYAIENLCNEVERLWRKLKKNGMKEVE